MNKIVVVTLAMVLVASMAYAGVASNGLLLAKKSHESGGSSTGPSSSGNSGSSGGSSGSNDGNDGNSGTSDQGGDQNKNTDQKEINNPLHPGKEDNKDISDIPSENCSHGKCATPITPTHEGGGISCADNVGNPCSEHSTPTGNFPHHCHFLRDCIPHIHIPHNTVVIHKTKVIHQKDIHTIATVFVPKIGLVEPLNCKLNENNGKISCEFVVVKVVN